MERKRKIAEERRWKERANRNILKNYRRRRKEKDDEKKKIIERKRRKTMKMKDKPEIFKKNK